MACEFVREAEADMTFDARLDLSAFLSTVALPSQDAHFFPEERPYLVLRVLTIIPNWAFNRVVEWCWPSDETVFQCARINHAYVFGFPGDLSNRLGWELKQLVRRDHVMTLSHTNDYSLGYVLTREEYDMGGALSLGGSERIQCYFGKRASAYCTKVAWTLANGVKEEGASDVLRFEVDDRPGYVPGVGDVSDAADVQGEN